MKTPTHSKDGETPLPLSALRLLTPPLRLVSAAMWKVMQQRDAVHYGKLEEIITSIFETVPGLLNYRHQARLRMGLRALMILEELRQSDPPDTQHVLQELGKLQAFSVTNGNNTDQKVEEAKRNFHSLVQCLLKGPATRKQFFKEDFHVQYGGHYMASLEKLLWEFLTRLDQLLPVPDLAQTVSWLSAAPTVLEECAHSASQPHLLRTLLQHDKCLGHLGSVLHTIQSESTHTSNRVISSALLTPRDSRKTTHVALSQVAPVIGSISIKDLQKNVPTMKAASTVVREVESASERSTNTRTKQRSCSEKEILEKDPEQDHFVGNMLVSVISQSSESEKEEERDNIENRNDRESSSEGEGKLDGRNRNGEKERYVQREYSPKRNIQGLGSQEQTDLSALHISCTKRQPKVVIPRLNISSANLPVRLNYLTGKQDDTRSLHQANVKDIFGVGNRDSVARKRKLIDLTPTPQKHMVDIIDKQTLSTSPCIPRVLHCIMATPETPSPITDDIIVDSEDESTDKVRRKVFTQHYCKTKNGTYVPTLHEYWNSMLYCRDVASLGK